MGTTPSITEMVLALTIDQITIPKEYARNLAEHLMLPCNIEHRWTQHHFDGIQRTKNLRDYDFWQYTCEGCRTTRYVRVEK